ncbi:MAG: DUF2793 domain-containing protein [Pseudomonadota bacterium]
MADPVEFPSTTPGFAIPLLFAGQSQKEFFINQAFGLIDSFMQRAVVESTDTTPTAPEEGSAYRVLANASGAWSGYDDAIAIYIGGAWQFVTPTQGMAVFDRAAEKWLVFRSTWVSAEAQTPPVGGAVVDSEARVAIDNLVNALRAVGVLPTA